MKWIGAIIILLGSCCFGLSAAARLSAEVRSLRKLMSLLDFMSCELQYRLTPLPDLCRQAAFETSGTLRHVFLRFAEELDSQISPDVKSCMNAALSGANGLSDAARKCMLQLGSSMGRFDLSGQISALESVRQSCRRNLEILESGKDSRLRMYKTLGICAGAAIVILLV